MTSERPPPYRPHFPEDPSGNVYPQALTSQPATFPGSSYQKPHPVWRNNNNSDSQPQTFPQSYAGHGDHSYYQAPPGPLGPPGAFMPHPGSQAYQSAPPYHWDGHKSYGEPPKHTVVMVEQKDEDHNQPGGGAAESCLAACSTILCCCCIFDMLSHLCCSD